MAYTPESICCTSVEDARTSLRFITDPDDYRLIRKAYEYEVENQNRVTMKDMLLSKMHRLYRERTKQTAGTDNG